MTIQMIRVLLATSDEEKWTNLQRYLTQRNFIVVDAVTNVVRVPLFLQRTDLDLVVIDCRLLWAQGLSLCQDLQSVHPQIKIVLITNADETLQLSALQTGVAACFHRDLPLSEWPCLLTHINNGGVIFNRAVIEQILTRDSPDNGDADPVTIGPLVIDLSNRSVTLDERRIHLTPREFELLACLVRSIGQVATFEQLLTEGWDYGSSAQVRTYIARLRRKLTDKPDLPPFIVTERGVGYHLRSVEQWRRAGRRV